MVVLCNIQVLLFSCRILVILDSDADTRRRATLAIVASVTLAIVARAHDRRPAPGPADLEGSSVTWAIVAAAAARPRRLGRFKCNPGHSAASGPGSGRVGRPAELEGYSLDSVT